MINPVFKTVIAVTVINTFCCLSLIAQNKKWGIGLTVNANIFAHANDNLYANSDFKPQVTRSLGINFKREIESVGRFKTQIALHLLKKKIGLGFSEKSGATTFRQSITYEFFSADIGVNVLYQNPEWRYNLRPFVGLSFSSAYFSSVSFHESSSSIGLFQGIGIAADTPDSLHKWVFYPCINLGVSTPFKFTRAGRQWECTLSAQLSPRQSFQNLEVPSPTSSDWKLLRGHFHHITFAINRFF